MAKDMYLVIARYGGCEWDFENHPIKPKNHWLGLNKSNTTS